MPVPSKDSLPVVPAKAGTHNHMKWFGEDSAFGTPAEYNR
jgi:hypothetical protein